MQQLHCSAVGLAAQIYPALNSSVFKQSNTPLPYMSDCAQSDNLYHDVLHSCKVGSQPYTPVMSRSRIFVLLLCMLSLAIQDCTHWTIIMGRILAVHIQCQAAPLSHSKIPLRHTCSFCAHALLPAGPPGCCSCHPSLQLPSQSGSQQAGPSAHGRQHSCAQATQPGSSGRRAHDRMLCSSRCPAWCGQFGDR